MLRTPKEITIDSICPVCAGKGFVPHRHLTNKRNKKKCAHCDGHGDLPKKVTTEG